MGKKSIWKNIMVTLGCAAFAGAYALGGGYVVGTFINGADGTRPAWLERVEIHVDESVLAGRSGNGTTAETAGTGGMQNASSAPQTQGAGNSLNHNGRNDKSGSDDTLQKPRFDEDEEEETRTDEELESAPASEEDSEQAEEGSRQTEEKEKAEDTDDKKKDEKDKKDKKDTARVSHVEIIDQEDQALAVLADVTAVVRTAMPCVVSITNEYTAYDYWYDEEYDDQANGSGIIVAQSDEELLIVTNYHVVEDNNNLYVQFIDEEEAIAYVKGISLENDLAIVSVFLEDMSDDTLACIAIAALGDSDSLQVGEPAIAIGNSLGYGQSVTTGVISALNRNVFADDPDMVSGYLIQTDAAINPGNSGGALLNVKGEVIGINSSKIADYVIEGMGYAIPISTAKPIIEDLMQKETRRKVPEEERAFLGISGTDVIEEATARYEMPEGVYVSNVLEDTAADAAGILKGDIIIYIDGEKITRMEELQGLLEYYSAGTEVEVVLMRQNDGEYTEQTIDVRLGYKE